MMRSLSVSFCVCVRACLAYMHMTTVREARLVRIQMYLCMVRVVCTALCASTSRARAVSRRLRSWWQWRTTACRACGHFTRPAGVWLFAVAWPRQKGCWCGVCCVLCVVCCVLCVVCCVLCVCARAFACVRAHVCAHAQTPLAPHTFWLLALSTGNEAPPHGDDEASTRLARG